MIRVRAAANLLLGTGVVLTICLSLALAALDIRLFSPWRRDVPPGLPGLILALALAAGSFLFLGWRLRRGQKVRLGAYQSSLGLVILSLLLLVRQTARLFGADWPLSGSVLLGMNGLVLGAAGTLIAPTTRGALVEPEASPAEAEDLRAEVEALVGEIQEEYRRLPVPPPRLTTWQLIREGFLRPAQAFRELHVRPHLELCAVVPLLVVLWPSLTVLADPEETAGVLLLAGIDYGLWLVLYDLGKAAMFWALARVLGRPLGYASALSAFMIIDFPSLTTYVVEHLWRDQYAWTGTVWYNRAGLGSLFIGLAGTYPAVFEALAKVDYLHIWTFLLWWIAVIRLIELRVRIALLVTLVTFPGAHLFAWFANLLLHVIRWQ